MVNEIKIGQTKMVSYCAVGAICRAGDECFVICDTSRWTCRDGGAVGTPIPIVRQHLKSRLSYMGFVEGIQLRTPPILKSRPDGTITGSKIPAIRFPSWMVCLKCRKLHKLPWVHITKINGDRYDSVSEIKCDNSNGNQRCNGRLEFVQYVLVHESGCLDDIPWEKLSHMNENSERRCEFRDDLYFERNDRGRLQLRCGRCAHKEDIGGIKNPGFWGWYKHMKKQPWLFESFNVPDTSSAYALSITDVNVHIPKTINALDIPPESDIDDSGLHSRLQQDERYEQLINWTQDGQSRLFKNSITKISSDFKCKTADLIQAFEELQNGWPNLQIEGEIEYINEEQMKEKEFQALCEKRTFEQHARFVTKNITEEWMKYTIEGKLKYADTIADLVLVEKLKEIQVFAGFNRFRERDLFTRPNLGDNTACDWLPACELYGEGLFFSLNEKIITKWENIKSVKERAMIINDRKEEAQLNSLPMATSRFLLLHTISHLLIKELEFVCGYPAASIKERIFCSPAINGILLYIAVPSKLGSLGGLVDQCKPSMFHRLLSRSFEKSYQCSYDPICAEHEGQGMGQLNRAACHGCLLLPEITCENNNCLLDRKFLIGDAKVGMPGFIQYILEN